MKWHDDLEEHFSPRWTQVGPENSAENLRKNVRTWTTLRYYTKSLRWQWSH